MLYKNFETGEVFDQGTLKEAAQLEGITVDQYITNYDLQMVPDFGNTISNENFQPDTTEEIATAVSGTGVSNQNIMGSNLEDISLESMYVEQESELYKPLREAEAELERVTKNFTASPLFNLSRIESAKNRVREEKRKLTNADSEINFDVPETVIEKSSEQVFEALVKEYPSINFNKKGLFDSILADLGGEVVTLNLDPWTSVGEQEAYEVLEKIKKYDARLSAKERFTGITMGLWNALEVGGPNQKDNINKQLDIMGLEIVPYEREGFTEGMANRGYALVDKETQEVLAEDQGGLGRAMLIGDEGNIQAYLRKNLKPEQEKALYDRSFEILREVTEIKALTKKEQEDLIKNNPKSTWKAYAENGFNNIANLARLQKNPITQEPLFTQQEIELLESGLDEAAAWMFQKGGATPTSPTTGITTSSDTRPTPLNDYKGTIERYLSGDELYAYGRGVVRALPKELVDKLLQGNWLETGLKHGLQKTQEQQLIEVTRPLYENIIGNLGDDRTLFDLAKRWESLPTDALNDAIEDRVKKVKQANHNISELIDYKLKDIYSKLPEGSRLNYVDVSGNTVAEIAWEGEGKLSKEEQKVFDEQSTEFYKLQQTIERLQSDRKKYVTDILYDTKLIKDYNENVDHELTDLGFKEYDLGTLFLKDFWHGTKSIGLTVPTLLGSEWAKNEQRLMNMDEKYYKTMVAPEMSLEYILRTLGQQMPNVIMAIGTGSVGSKFLSDTAVKWAIAGTFGFSSGTEKFRQLDIQQDLHKIALDQRRVLTKAYDEGRIDQFNYAIALEDINQTLAFSKMTDNQKIMSSVANGIVEGTVTRFVAGAPNTMKILKDFRGSPSILKHVGKTPIQQYGLYFKDYGGRLGLEVLEEEIIYFGQQGIGEWGILDRKFDLSHADDVFWATIVTAGVSQAPGITYSAMNNMVAYADWKKDVSKLVGESKELNALMNGNLPSDQLNILVERYASILQEVAAKQNALGVDVIGLGPKKLQELIELNLIQKALYEEAGVTAEMNETERDAALKAYKGTLTTNQKKALEDQLNTIDENIYTIQNGPKDYNRVKEIIGEENFKFYQDRLNKQKPPGWRKNLPLREKLGFVIEEIRKQAKADNLTRAKKDPKMQKFVDEQVEGMAMAMQESGIKNPKLTKKQIDNFWDMAAEMHARKVGYVISIASEVNRNAKKLLGDQLKNLIPIELPENESEVNDLLNRMVNSKEMTMDVATQIREALKTGSLGFIVGDKYIVKNKAEAEKELKLGNLRAGVVILHELDHAMDDAYFGNTMVDGVTVLSEDGREYVLNLEEAIRTHKNKVVRAMHNQVLYSLLEQYGATDAFGKPLPFAEQSDTFLDEYSREIKTYLYAEQGRMVDLEVSESLIDRIFWTQDGMKINSPEKALKYVLTSNAAFRQGKTTTKFKRKTREGGGSFKAKGTGVKFAKASELAVEYKKRALTPAQEKDFTKQYLALGIDALGRWAAKRGVPVQAIKNAPDIEGKLIDQLESATKNFKPINPVTGKKQEFSTYLDSFLGRRIGTKIVEAYETRKRISSQEELKDKGKQIVDKSKPSNLQERAKKEAQEVAPSLKTQIKGSKKTELEKETKQAVAKEIRYKLPKYDEDITVKQQTNLVKELGKGLPNTEIEVTRNGKTKKQKLFHSVIDFMGAKNKTVNEYDTWLTENYTTLLGPNGLTTTYLSKAFPQAVEKYIIGEGWVKYPQWKGKKVGTKPGNIATWRSAEEGPYQGTVARHQKMRRIKDVKNVIPLATFKGKYIKYKGDKLTIPQMPTQGLAKQIAKEMGLITFGEELKLENSEIRKDFLERQKLLGALILENFVEQINLDLQREGVKYSVSNLDFDTASYWLDNRYDFFEKVQEAFPGLQSKYSKPKTIRILTKLHKQIYGDRIEIEEEDHIAIAKQFADLLVIPLKASTGFYTTPRFFEYMEDIVFATDTNQAIVEFTGADTSITEMLGDLGAIMEGRRVIEDEFAPYLIKKYGENQALILLATFAPGTFSNGSKFIGAFDSENKFKRHGKDSDRVTLFGKKDTDVLENIIKKHFPDVTSIAAPNYVMIDGKKKRQGNKITFTEESGKESIPLNINIKADVELEYVKDQLSKKEIEKLENDAHKAWEFTVDLITTLDNKTIGNNTRALILATSNGGMHTSLRLGARVWGRATVMEHDLKIPKLANAKNVKDGKAKNIGDKMYNKKGELIMENAYRYEHSLPARVVLWYLYDSIVNKNKSIPLELLEDDYRVNIIPRKEMDDVVTEVGLGQTMLASYKPGDQTWWKRYYNIFTMGRMPYALESLENPQNIIGKEWQDYFEYNKKALIKPDAQQTVDFNNNADIAMADARNSLKYSQNIKGMSVYDFDDTLAITDSKVIVYLPYYAPGSMTEATMELTPAEFAERHADLESMGASFDFSQFNKVIGGKKGPLAPRLKKAIDKFGNRNIYILTARPQSAAKAIYEFLKGIGLEIRIENIVGLQDGSPKAKADWMVNKAAEGYNDFYFVDDALKNVKAVKDVLNVLDVKSKVQQARVKFSKNLNIRLNEMIARHKKVNPNATYSKVVAARKGRNKGRLAVFVPPSADDFRGLTQYTFAGKGKQGEADQAFFEKSLVIPYARGVAAMEQARNRVSNDFAALKVAMPLKKYRNVFGNLKKIPDTEYTYDEAIRVYLWTKAGIDMREHGMSARDQKMLDKIVRENPELLAFADGVLLITNKDTYVPPQKHWMAGTILGDLNTLTEKVNRKEYIAEFITNVDIMFDEPTLDKIEALYGTRTRVALENMIYRMKTGTNRVSGGTKDSITNAWNNWVNRSIGAIMFLNRRSALLQLMSTVNFLNWSDNNPMQAAVAFANQPQFWSDVVYLFNSPKLKQRRAGLKGDVNEAEIAAAVKGATDKFSAFISVLLKYGFTFTQIADSVAIATGGASFYRNRINSYKKQKLGDVEAEAKAFEDFSLISDETQQSADPMLISQEQAGTMGRLVLAFQNTPMQYTRLIKKASMDLAAGRGDPRTHISKIIYYGAIQNFIFSALQAALFGVIPGFEEDPEDEKEALKRLQKKDQRLEKTVNGMIDTILRGSGLKGAILSTVKNVIRQYYAQEEKGFLGDHAYTLIEAANISPPLGSKMRKIYSAIQTGTIFEKDVIAERGFDVTIDGKFQLSPTYSVIGDLASGIFNIPLDRLVIETNSITEALDERNTAWQRLALALGWRTWDVNAKIEEHDLIKVAAKEKRKREGIEKAKITRAETKRVKDSVYNALPDDVKLQIQIDKQMESFRKKLEKFNQ